MARPFQKLLARFTLTFFSQNPFFFQVHSMSSMLSLVLHLLLQSTSVTSLQKIHTTVDNPSISLHSLHPPGHPAGGRSTLSSLPSLTHQPIMADNPPVKRRKTARICGRTSKAAKQKSRRSAIAAIDPALDTDEPAVEAPTNNPIIPISLAPVRTSSRLSAIAATNSAVNAEQPSVEAPTNHPLISIPVAQSRTSSRRTAVAANNRVVSTRSSSRLSVTSDTKKKASKTKSKTRQTASKKTKHNGKQLRTLQNQRGYLKCKLSKTEESVEALNETVTSLENANKLLALVEVSAQARAEEARALAEHHGQTLATRTERFDNFKDKKTDAIKTIRHKAKAKVERMTAEHSASVALIRLASQVSNVMHRSKRLHCLLTFLSFGEGKGQENDGGAFSKRCDDSVSITGKQCYTPFKTTSLFAYLSFFLSLVIPSQKSQTEDTKQLEVR